MAEWSGLPAYKQVAADLRRRIVVEGMKVGDPLPSHKTLMKEHGVSITVARRAIDELVKEGIAVTHQGKGSSVRALPAKKKEGEPVPSGFDAVMRQLATLDARMAGIEQRMDQIEAQLPQGPNGTRPGRRGRSTRPDAP